MPASRKQIKARGGFTLIEILLVVFLMALLATTAISSYTNSTGTFQFLSSYQQVLSAFRTARSNAISNEQQNGISPKRYGLCITKTRVITFADSGDKELKLDLTDANKAKAGDCNDVDIFAIDGGANQDTILAEKTFVFDTQGYVLDVLEMDGLTKVELPVLIFYENGTGNLLAVDGKNIKIDKAKNKYFNVSFKEIDGDLLRYLRVFQVSGLAEESITP